MIHSLVGCFAKREVSITCQSYWPLGQRVRRLQQNIVINGLERVWVFLSLIFSFVLMFVLRFIKKEIPSYSLYFTLTPTSDMLTVCSFAVNQGYS